MPRFIVRRAGQEESTSVAAPLVFGLGIGVALGFFLGELAGPATGRAVSGRGRRDPAAEPLSALVAEAQSVLDDDVQLRDCQLKVIAVGRGRIELHGWVLDRRSRARAAHLVGDAVDADAIINCILVRGEDDRVGAAGDDDSGDDELAG